MYAQMLGPQFPHQYTFGALMSKQASDGGMENYIPT